MKNILITTGLILIFSIFGFGQKQTRQTAASSASGSGASTTAVSSNNGTVLNSGTVISGELQNTLDVKKAKVGDPVVLKTVKAVKQNGQTIVPKGASLIGHVTDVAQKTKNNGSSRLGMVFDRIEGKDLSAPISASIVSITSAATAANIAGVSDADLMGSSSTSARSSGGGAGLLGGGGSGGGGLLGGVGNTVGSVTNTAGGTLNTATQTVGGVTNSVGQTVGSTTGSVIQTVNGIQISNSVGASAQSGTTLSATDRNLKLDKGTSLQLQLNSSARSQ